MYCSGTITHVIRQGDTIYRLAKSYDTSVPEILMQNPGVNPYNLQVGSTLLICPGGNTNIAQDNEMELNQKLRRLWEQYSYWMRMYILSIAKDDDDNAQIRERLEQIPIEMGSVFAEYYPPEIAESLRKRLVEFTDGMMQLVSLVKGGNAEETDRLDVELEQDVTSLAEILSNMNINFDKEDLEREIGEYLMLTKREIVARLSGEYADDVDTFDELERQALKLADYLSNGIMRQRQTR